MGRKRDIKADAIDDIKDMREDIRFAARVAGMGMSDYVTIAIDEMDGMIADIREGGDIDDDEVEAYVHEADELRAMVDRWLNDRR
jgi:hypothetical protein